MNEEIWKSERTSRWMRPQQVSWVKECVCPVSFCLNSKMKLERSIISIIVSLNSFQKLLIDFSFHSIFHPSIKCCIGAPEWRYSELKKHHVICQEVLPDHSSRGNFPSELLGHLTSINYGPSFLFKCPWLSIACLCFPLYCKLLFHRSHSVSPFSPQRLPSAPFTWSAFALWWLMRSCEKRGK